MQKKLFMDTEHHGIKKLTRDNLAPETIGPEVKPKPWFYTTSGLQVFSLRGLLELNRFPSTASFGFS